MHIRRFAARMVAAASLFVCGGLAMAQETGQGGVAEPACELHFWPTADAIAGHNIFLNPAFQRGVITGNVLLDALPARAQVAGLERADPARLLGLPGVRVILATEPVSDSVAARQRTRLTSSTAPCYAELVVKRMGYRADPFQGRSFGAVFIYRRFAPGGAPAEIVQGAGDVNLRIFPAREEAQREAAAEEMLAAFATVFEKFVRRRVAR